MLRHHVGLTDPDALKSRMIAARNAVATGWKQGNDKVPGKTCAVIAISDHGGVWRWELCRQLTKSLGLGNEPGELIGWNDAPGRTQEDVVAAFDRLIAAMG